MVELSSESLSPFECRITRSSTIKIISPDNLLERKKKNVSFSSEAYFDLSDTSLLSDGGEKSPKKKGRRRKRGSGINRLKDLSLSSETDLVSSECIQTIPAHVLRPHHYLRSSWTFWLYVNDSSRSWEQNQTKLATVDTIEDFWLVFNRIMSASDLPPGYDFSVFRTGIFPDWEDFQNMAGGRWVYHGSVKQRKKLNAAWLEILVFLIGEHAGEEADLLNGGVVNMRKKSHKIALWLKEARSMEKVVSIGRMMKTKLGGVDNADIQFCLHQEDRELARRDRKTRDRLPIHL